MLEKDSGHQFKFINIIDPVDKCGEAEGVKSVFAHLRIRINIRISHFQDDGGDFRYLLLHFTNQF